jgi:hypothetical protein
MSILKIASLIVTANAYEESKILAVVPSNGSGDLDFVRASTKTRVNPEGFIEDIPYNLVKHSEDFENTDWLKIGVTIDANIAIAPNNTLTANRLTENNQNDFHTFRPGNILYSTIENRIVTYSMFLKFESVRYVKLHISESYTNSAAVVFDLLNGTIATPAVSIYPNNYVDAKIVTFPNGWYRCSLSCFKTNTTAYAALYFSKDKIISHNESGYSYQGNGTDSLLAWGAQFVKSSVEKPYFPTTNRLNIPSIDYTGGGCPSILLEPQRTNLLINNNDFSAFGKEGVIDVNNATAPDGTFTANKFTPTVLGNLTTSGTDGSSNRLFKDIITSNSTYTNSVYVKSVSGNNFNISIFVVNRSSDTIKGINTFVVTNKWQRIIVTGTTDGAGTGVRFLLQSAQAVFLWGGQCEQGSYATSYIPTQGSAVTRIADSFTKSNIFTNNFITSLGGTWLLELNDNFSLTRDGGGYGIFLGSDNLDPNNLLGIRTISTGRFTIYKIISTVITDLYNTLTETIKVVFKWNGLNLDVFVNGIKVVSSSSFSITNMEFLVAQGQSTTKKVKSTILFSTPLSDEECILLSSTSYNTYQEMAKALNYVTQ